MNFRLKIIVAVFPFLLLGYIGFSLIPPLFEDANAKDVSIGEKKTELEGLEAKLPGQAKLLIKKRELEQEIASLYESVPRSPDLDLFTIDMEKMCEQSGIDLISVGPPKAAGGEGEDKDQPAYMRRPAPPPLPGDKDKIKENKPKTGLVEGTNLQEIPRRIMVTGDYNGIQKFVHDLETYQRALKITEINSFVPKKITGGIKAQLPDEAMPGPQDELENPEQLVGIINITTYYMP